MVPKLLTSSIVTDMESLAPHAVASRPRSSLPVTLASSLKRSSALRRLPDSRSSAAMADTDPYAFNDDGTAKDPRAFQQALRADAERMAALDAEPAVKSVVLGDDMFAFQELIKGVYHDEKKRQERASKAMSERTIDAQRASATVPRDTVQLYKQLYDAGLQYGPAFRLLRNVHVPDVS